MIKYLFLILVTLLSGCTTDFSGLEKPEESVYIRFSSHTNVQVDVEEATRNGYTTPGESVGILGIATYSDEQTETMTLAGQPVGSLRQWMANDVYYCDPQGDGKVNIVHNKGESPVFPIDKGSGMVVYAYKPHTERMEYDNDGYYLPLDLMADSAATDWRFSGRKAKSKEMYRMEGTFALDSFKHAMTCVDVVLTPKIDKWDPSFKIVEVALGMYSHGKGRLSVEDGKVEMDTASYEVGSIHHLQRRLDNLLSIYSNVVTHTESFYLMPYTRINDLRVVGIWNDKDTIVYEYDVADRWNSDNLHPGTRSIINVNLKNKQ